MERANNERGFTLIEMMIALIIGAIVMAPLYVVTRGTSDQSEADQQETEAMQRARMGLELLVRDFRSTGLFVSPNTAIDRRCENANRSGNAQYRSAVVHLNRGGSGFDSVMLSGNFLGGKVYRGYLNGNVIAFQSTGDTAGEREYECTTQFNPVYAFAHLVAPTGNMLDVGVASVDFTAGTGECELTLLSQDLTAGDKSIADFGQAGFFSVSANQTALYFVESVATPEGPRNDLVRYFVDYQSDSSESATCTALGATTATQITLPGNSAVEQGTRQVIAEYVEDFQVWFRPMTTEVINGTTTWSEPHYYSIGDVVGEREDKFSNGFLPSSASYILPLSAATDTTTDTTSVSCTQVSGSQIGPERVRSAIIRLAVSTERTDQAIDFRAFSATESRIVQNTLRAYSAADGGPADRIGALYKIKTLVAEVMMPNLSARSDLVAP